MWPEERERGTPSFIGMKETRVWGYGAGDGSEWSSDESIAASEHGLQRFTLIVADSRLAINDGGPSNMGRDSIWTPASS